MKTDKELLNDAFKQLRKQNYFAKQDFWCCQTCGCAAVPKEKENAYVFYHRQDKEAIDESGNIKEKGMYVAWAGKGKQIVDIISQTGLKVYWNGSNDTRIRILSQNTTPEGYEEITKKSKKCC